MYACYDKIIIWLKVVSHDYNKVLSERFTHLYVFSKLKDSSHLRIPMSYYYKMFTWGLEETNVILYDEYDDY